MVIMAAIVLLGAIPLFSILVWGCSLSGRRFITNDNETSDMNHTHDDDPDLKTA